MKFQPTWPVVALAAIVAALLGILAIKGVISGAAILGFLGGTLLPTFNIYRGGTPALQAAPPDNKGAP